MRINGDGIYGSSAWKVFGEGADGVMNVLPGGSIGRWQAEHPFHTTDMRFTKGKDGALYAWCMTVPAAGEKLSIRSLGSASGLMGGERSRRWSCGVQILRSSGRRVTRRWRSYIPLRRNSIRLRASVSSASKSRRNAGKYRAAHPRSPILIIWRRHPRGIVITPVLTLVLGPVPMAACVWV